MWRWLSVLIDTTCATCSGRHGQLREYADWLNLGLPGEELHPNCYCEIVPEGFDTEDADPVDLRDFLSDDFDDLDGFGRAEELRRIARELQASARAS